MSEWNGVVVSGALPDPSVPAFLAARDIDYLRVPLAEADILRGNDTQVHVHLDDDLTDLMAAAVVAGVGITFAVTWTSRPTVARAVDVVRELAVVVGASTALVGIDIFDAPNYQVTASANEDAALPAYADYSWAQTGSATTPDHQVASLWLEDWSALVAADLRTAGYSGALFVPVFPTTSPTESPLDVHPRGPWISGAGDIWYVLSFQPFRPLDSSFDQYETEMADTFGYRTYVDAGYFTQGQTSNQVTDADPIGIPVQQVLPPDPGSVPSLPVTALTAVPFNDAALVTWEAPENFGGGVFMRYIVSADDAELLGYQWSIDDPTVESIVIPLANDTEWTITVLVETTAAEPGVNDGPTTTVTPVASAGAPPAVPINHDDFVDPGDNFVPRPEPMIYAFPQTKVFTPDNFMKTPEEVDV